MTPEMLKPDGTGWDGVPVVAGSWKLLPCDKKSQWDCAQWPYKVILSVVHVTLQSDL